MRPYKTGSLRPCKTPSDDGLIAKRLEYFLGNGALEMLAIGAHWLPDRNVALLLQHTRQRVMPSLTVRPMKLDVENVLVALPGFIEHEVVLGRRVPVEDRLMEHGFVPHRVEHAFQELSAISGSLAERETCATVGSAQKSTSLCVQAASCAACGGRADFCQGDGMAQTHCDCW